MASGPLQKPCAHPCFKAPTARQSAGRTEAPVASSGSGRWGQALSRAFACCPQAVVGVPWGAPTSGSPLPLAESAAVGDDITPHRQFGTRLWKQTPFPESVSGFPSAPPPPAPPSPQRNSVALGFESCRPITWQRDIFIGLQFNNSEFSPLCHLKSATHFMC